MIIKGKFLFIMSEFFYPADLYRVEIDTNNIPFQETFNTFLRRLFKCSHPQPHRRINLAQQLWGFLSLKSCLLQTVLVFRIRC